MRYFQALMAFLLGSLALVACGGGGDGNSIYGDGSDSTSFSILVAISSSTLSTGGSATVTATVTTSAGKPVQNKVVSFSLANGVTIGTLSAPTALTDANGNAVVTLTPSSAIAAGAETVTASVGSDTSTVTGTASFQVVSTAAAKVDLIFSSNSVTPEVPVTVTAHVTSGAGASVNNALVSFSLKGILGALNATTALTDSSGNASVILSAASANASGADTLYAAVSDNSQTVASFKNFQVAVSPAARITVAVSSSTVTSVSPSTVTATVTSSLGVPVPNAIVNFNLGGSVAALSANSALTDVNGSAKVVLSAASLSSSGADTVTAATTAGASTVSSSSNFEVISSAAANIAISLSSSTVTSTSPATVTAKVTSNSGLPIKDSLVSFSVTGTLGVLGATSALTDSNGLASVSLSPALATVSGADTVTARTTTSGITVASSVNFQLVATSATFTSFAPVAGAISSSPLSAYGQSVLNVVMAGVTNSAPVVVNFSSNCVSAGKAIISPASVSTTTGVFSLSYVDKGCGALLSADPVTASVSGKSTLKQTSIYLSSPSANSLKFVSASPETIYLRGTGLGESSTVLFQVNDTAGNPLPGQSIVLNLSTFAGDLKLDGGSVAISKTTDTNGQVSVIVNSGTVPTPVRVSAALASGANTVSSNLAVAVGLPSQTNFTFGPKTFNIEGYNLFNTADTFTVLAADRSGNPVPDGTAIVLWAEGGQIQSNIQTQTVSGIASATANFVTAQPVPVDGRATVVAYALGEESFIDLNGNNTYDLGEPFQDLGNISKDVLFDNVFDSVNDEFVSLSGVAAGSKACVDSSASYSKFKISQAIPTIAGTCDGKWTQRTYVRRASELVFSTSSANLTWYSTSGIDRSQFSSGLCPVRSLQSGSNPSVKISYYEVFSGTTWYTSGATSGSIPFYVSDANPVRFNPMAAGTLITVADATTDLTVTVGGTPVPNTTEASVGVVNYKFATGAGKATSGSFTLKITSPSGLTTEYGIGVNQGSPALACQ